MNMRYRSILLSMLLGTATFAGAQQISIFIGQPHVSIGIDFPVYPEFVRVPNYPVYYAPHANSNVFYYDGLYWVYNRDRWYASTWYNGPWGEVAPEGVPYFVLRVPVRYYGHPPTYFSGWAVDAPPRWDQHWGASWTQKRSGWDQWNRNSSPAPAPLPVYQRQYSGDRYPKAGQQQVLQSQQYRYQPREAVVQQYYRQQAPKASATTSVPQGTRTQANVQESAREFAPGQVKKQQGAQSAREFAPGQVKHNDVAQAVEPRTAPVDGGKGKGKGQDKGNDKGNDGDGGQGKDKEPSHDQGQGKGKGHGKD